jgi:dephospho-CoA kinase
MVGRMGVVVVLYGPKAAGKSQAAEALRVRYGVRHVEAEAIVLDL